MVVLLAEAHDAVVRQAGDLLPDGDGLVVLVVDGGVEVLLVEAVATLALAAVGNPGERDRALLEVVTEREVAVHLEERAMAGRLSDLFDVEGAHATTTLVARVNAGVSWPRKYGLTGPFRR